MTSSMEALIEELIGGEIARAESDYEPSGYIEMLQEWREKLLAEAKREPT
jgi:hypothetical protein